MPFPLAPAAGPALRGALRPSRAVGATLLAAASAAIAAAVLTGADGTVALAVAVAALLASGLLSLRAQWRALAPRPTPAPALHPPTGSASGAVAERLGDLHRAHVEKVNAALDHGRPDLARDLSENYVDESLRLILEG